MFKTKFSLNILLMALALTFMGFFSACDDDDDNEPGAEEGRLQIEITDAPIDDDDVKGVYVTISQLEIDGEAVENFQRQTIDLTAYRNGETEVLGTFNVDADTYSRLSLVLDYNTDANGGSPGLYVLTQDNQKENLNAGTQTTQRIEISNGNFQVNENETTRLVIDFDLRKAVGRSGADDYSLVTTNELNNSIRIVTADQTGRIEGRLDNWDNYADKVVVYAYRKGQFNENTETEEQGEGKITFRNAITSALVADNGEFELHFLPAGQYELYFAAYTDADNNGSYDLGGSFSMDILNNVDLKSITVSNNSAVNIDLDVTGLLPL